MARDASNSARETAHIEELYRLDFESLPGSCQLVSLFGRAAVTHVRMRAIDAGERGDHELDELLQKHAGLIAKELIELVRKREAQHD